MKIQHHQNVGKLSEVKSIVRNFEQKKVRTTLKAGALNSDSQPFKVLNVEAQPFNPVAAPKLKPKNFP